MPTQPNASEKQRFQVRDLREPGWCHVDNEILDLYGRKLGAYGVAVYTVLCRYAKAGTQSVHLSTRDIGAVLGISHDRVRKSLADLTSLGLIHLEVPERPGPGVISTITLLNVKTTGRHMSSCAPELDATRPRNKEEKTKTKQTPPTPPAGGLTPRQRKDLSKELNDIYQASVGMCRDKDFDERALQTACARLLLPYEQAKVAVAESAPT